MLWTFIIHLLQCIFLIIRKPASLQTHPNYRDFDLSHQDHGELLIPMEMMFTDPPSWVTEGPGGVEPRKHLVKACAGHALRCCN